MIAQDTYLQLLRRSIGFASAPLDDVLPVDPAIMAELLRISRMHGTEPLIYNELLKSASFMPKQQAMAMKQACVHNMLLQADWEKVIVKVWQSLSADTSQSGEKGVYAVLMKGFSYARLYPLPYLRAWGDLDVWVGPEQYHRACGLLRAAFPEAKHHDEEWDELKHYCFVFPNGMAIELHRVSMDFLDKKEQVYWESLSPNTDLSDAGTNCSISVSDVVVPVFEPKYDMLFCFMHSWEHFCGSGIPLKQVCDMALLVQHARSTIPDWTTVETYLLKHLKALGMLEVWRSYGYMACKVLGLPFTEWPLLLQGDRLADDVVKYGNRLYEQVMMEGQTRKKDYGESGDRYEAREKARRMPVLARKWLTLRGRIDKARFLYRFAPKYARNILWQEIKKGIRRTIHRAEMINY